MPQATSRHAPVWKTTAYAMVKCSSLLGFTSGFMRCRVLSRHASSLQLLPELCKHDRLS